MSRSRLVNTLNLTSSQRNTALKVLATPSSDLKFNATIKYDTIFNHPFHATTPSIVTTTTPAPFICTEFIYKIDRYTKRTRGFASFYNPHTGLSYTCRLILVLTLLIIYIYLKMETKTKLEDRLNQDVKQRIKDRINERMTERIRNHRRRKNHTLSTNHTSNYQRPIIHYKTKIKEVEEFTISADYEAMWNIVIDKWTRNWNFYREKLTDSILSKFNINHKRQKRLTDLELIELTSQNANGSATGAQDIFIEHYDCEVDQKSNVKYYELNKIST